MLITITLNLEDVIPNIYSDKFGASSHDFIDYLNIYTYSIPLALKHAIIIMSLLLSLFCVLPRYVSILQAISTFSLFQSMIIVEGGDQINSIICFLVVLPSLLDNRVWFFSGSRRGQNLGRIEPFASVFQFLIRIQISVLYLNAGVAKLFQQEWVNGTAVYYWLNDPIFGAVGIIESVSDWLFLENIYLVSILNYLVIIFEVIISFSLLIKDSSVTRKLLIAAISFHFGIYLYHGLLSFFITMIGVLILYYTPQIKFKMPEKKVLVQG